MKTVNSGSEINLEFYLWNRESRIEMFFIKENPGRNRIIFIENLAFPENRRILLKERFLRVAT